MCVFQYAFVFIHLYVVICILYTSRSIMLMHVGVVLYIGLAYAALAGSLPAQPEVCRVCVANLCQSVHTTICCMQIHMTYQCAHTHERDIHTCTCLRIHAHTCKRILCNRRELRYTISMHVHAYAHTCTRTPTLLLLQTYVVIHHTH